MPKIEQGLRSGTSNLAEIQALLCTRIVGGTPGALLETGKESIRPVGDFLDWLGSNTGKIDAESAMAQLRTTPPILQDGETIKLAYKVHKDMVLFTTHRILAVDVSTFFGL